MSRARVRDAMSQGCWTVEENRPLARALDDMRGFGARTVAVLRADRTFRGVLVREDVEAALAGEDGDALTAGDVSRDRAAVAAGVTLETAQACLEAARVGALPVVDGDRAVGVISRHHIRYFTEQRRLREALRELRPPDRLLLRYNASEEEFFETATSGLRALKPLGLEPHHHVLDPGCGAGRMAIPLTQFLTSQGKYEGFDVFRDCIEWCSRTITPRYPNFGFRHADVAVTLHNPDGAVTATEFTFPYGDEEFDFAFLISLFTHMLPDGVARYVSELARVLRTGGRVFATFLLLNDETTEAIDAARSPSQPLHDFGHYRLSNPDLPEDGVAYSEAHVMSLLAQSGLEVVEVMRGDWASKEHPGMGVQDAVLAAKPGAGAANPALESPAPGA